MNRVPAHGVRPIHAVQLKVQPTGIAHHLAAHIPPPNCRRCRPTIRTGHILAAHTVGASCCTPSHTQPTGTLWRGYTRIGTATAIIRVSTSASLLLATSLHNRRGRILVVHPSRLGSCYISTRWRDRRSTVHSWKHWRTRQEISRHHIANTRLADDLIRSVYALGMIGPAWTRLLPAATGL